MKKFYSLLIVFSLFCSQVFPVGALQLPTVTRTVEEIQAEMDTLRARVQEAEKQANASLEGKDFTTDEYFEAHAEAIRLGNQYADLAYELAVAKWNTISIDEYLGKNATPNANPIHNTWFECYPHRPGEYFEALDPKNDSGDFIFGMLHMFPLPLGRWTSLESCQIPAGQTEYTIKPYNMLTIGWYEKMAVTVNVVLILLILWGIFRGMRWVVRTFVAGIRANARNHSDTL